MQQTDHKQTSTAGRAVSGGVLLAIGMLIVVVAWGYPVGSLTEMGPGYIPRAVGFLICGLAIVIITLDIFKSDTAPPGQMHWRGLMFISAAIIIFAVLVDVAGLLPSMFLAVMVSMFADDQARPLTVLIYSCLATLGGWLLFLVALELPIPALWR